MTNTINSATRKISEKINKVEMLKTKFENSSYVVDDLFRSPQQQAFNGTL